MTWTDLKTWALDEYYPALLLDRLVSHKLRLRIYSILRSLVIIFFLLSLIFLGVRQTSSDPRVVAALPNVIGVFCILFSLWMIAGALQAFYYSFYFKSIPDRASDALPMVTFELAKLLSYSPESDLLKGFLSTHEGRFILRRAGVQAKMLTDYFSGRKILIGSPALVFADVPHLGFTDYAEKLFDADHGFAQFLFAHGIQKKDFLALCDWVVERETGRKLKERWWSWDRLGRVPGIGKSFSYGQTYKLDTYVRPLPVVESGVLETHEVYGSKELKELESILIRKQEANVFLVGDNAEGKLEIVARLGRMIEEGTVFPELEHKQVIMLDTDILIAAEKTKGDFEQEFLTVMREAAEAGNIILVFPDFPAFLNSAQALGSDIVSLLDPYLTSAELQIIALSDTDRFHASLERHPALMQRFDKVLIEETDDLNTVKILENKIIPIEDKTGLLFTYQALLTIAESADRYITTGIMPDKAVNLLYELVPAVQATSRKVVRKEDVLALVKAKTGVVVGEIASDEREKLLSLESILHHRIIGQDEAVNAIANAVRRARSGINNPNRPLASFLFLGPTGVGKTETTKALAEVFFGAEARIERLDMSEYAGPDALAKLIGFFGSDDPGVLASMIREHPYGVLLLDEFEKTTKEVMNLFLQILDEGFFSDGAGKRINARNLLIIATSNAGSDLIWDAVKRGESLDHARDIIIDSIIHANIFKPELLNRFDGVIVFHPLAQEHLEKIARLQLERLQKRLAERGINLAITDDLVAFVLRSGTDPKFGARPMNRAIQDNVEQVIANKIIRGEAGPGAEIALTQADFSNG